MQTLVDSQIRFEAVSHGNSMEEMRLRLVDDAKRSLIAQVGVGRRAYLGSEVVVRF